MISLLHDSVKSAVSDAVRGMFAGYLSSVALANEELVLRSLGEEGCDRETTKKCAQKNPEKYSDLQMRVCGWNVLWNNLSPAEQKAYIMQAE